MNSKELKKKVSENWGDNYADDLVARSRSNENGSSSNREKSRSKSKFGKYHYCKKEGHWKKMSACYSKRKRRMMVLQILVM